MKQPNFLLARVHACTNARAHKRVLFSDELRYPLNFYMQPICLTSSLRAICVLTVYQSETIERIVVTTRPLRRALIYALDNIWIRRTEYMPACVRARERGLCVSVSRGEGPAQAAPVPPPRLHRMVLSSRPHTRLMISKLILL